MNFEMARREYLVYLSNSRAHNTVRSARQAIYRLPLYSTVDEVGEGAIERVLAGLDPATHNRYRSALSSFFDYCVRWGYCATNPVKFIASRKVVDQPKLILTPQQMLSMLDGANPVERVALAVGMNTGLRAGDITALRVGDVDLATDAIQVKIQKTGGYDEKPITKQLHAELERWLEQYSKKLGCDSQHMFDHSNYLVPSYTINVIVADGLALWPQRQLTHPHRIVQRGLERIGLPTKGEGFHALRRSSARALFEKLRSEGSYDHALMVVKEFLNHRSIDQTQLYLGLNHERAIRDEMLRGKDFLQ